MSDIEPKNKPAKTGPPASWTEHEALVYLFSAIEHSNVKVDFANAPAPAGRNASGCFQKMNKLKIALRAEIDAIKKGEAPPQAAEPAPKKTGGRKRKAKDDEDSNGGDESSKKRGRPKKAKSEPLVKDEVEEAVEEAPDARD